MKARLAIYLDHAAASPIRPTVQRAMHRWERTLIGNPSSITRAGKMAQTFIGEARQSIAKILGCHSDEIIFTGSGTESINLAIKGILEAYPTGDVIVSAIEHHAVLEAARAARRWGYTYQEAPVDSKGQIDLPKLVSLIRPTTRLISVMLANNEIGTVQPIVELARQLRRLNRDRKTKQLPRIYLHTDACQAAAYLDLAVDRLGADALSLNAAKVGGPKGVGCLYLRRGVPLISQIDGGGQEADRRAGTENPIGIGGLAHALMAATTGRAHEVKRLRVLRDRLLTRLRKHHPNLVVHGDLIERLPNNLSLSFPGIEAEPLVLYLDQDGLSVGAGAACSSRTLEPSHVLRAIGVPDHLALGAIRLTLGYSTTKEEVDEAVKRIHQRVTWFQKNRLQPLPA